MTITYKKPKSKKRVGRAEKEKKRKQREESRLAQRTGISAKERRLNKLLDKAEKFFKDKEKGRKEKRPERKFDDIEKYFKGKRGTQRDYLLQGGKKGGKVK